MSDGVRRVLERVPMEEAIRRATERMRGHKDTHTSALGEAIWPNNKFLNTQGAALAASRIVGEMKKRGLIKPAQYGWRLTMESR